MGSSDHGTNDAPVYTTSPLISSNMASVTGSVITLLVESLRILLILSIVFSGDVTSILVTSEPDCSSESQ